MNEFSETNDTSSETRDAQPEGTSFSDTFEGTVFHGQYQCWSWLLHKSYSTGETLTGNWQ